MDSKELCNYIERFRSARNVSQEHLTFDVVSVRQYRRYLNGESDMPFDIFVLLINKLGLKTESIIREMEVVRVEEYQYANKLYNFAVNYNFAAFDKLLSEKKFSTFVDGTSKLFYDFSLFLKDYYVNKINKKQAFLIVSKMLNYPTILKNDILTDIELLVLSFLDEVSGKVDQKKIVKAIMYFYNHREKIISGSSKNINILILAKFAKSFGIQGDFKMVIQFCDLGLDINKQVSSYYLSEYFYYYKALAYHKLEEYELFTDSLKKCFNILEVSSNANKFNKFKELIKDDFDLDFKTYVIKKYYESEDIKSDQLN